jgi:MFS family permease
MPIPPSLSTPRAAVMAVFAGFGVAAGVFAGSMPALARQAGLSTYEMGLGLTASTIATALAMALVGPAARHVSNRAALLVLLPAIALAVFAVQASGSAIWFYAAMMALGLFMGGTDLFMNAEAGAIEQDMKRPVFTAFHGAVSVTIALSALLGSYLSSTAGTLYCALAAAASLAVAWLMVWRQVPARVFFAPAEGSATALPHRRALVVIGLIAGLCVSCEIAAIQWSAKLLDDKAPELAAIAGIGVAFYGLCNALVRFGGDAIRARFGDFPTLRASLLVAIAGFAALGWSQSFATSVIAFAVIGFGAALLTPCTFASVTRLVPDQKARALSFAANVAGPSRMFSPFLFGWVAAAESTVFAFALCGAVLAVALALTFAVKSVPAR